MFFIKSIVFMCLTVHCIWGMTESLDAVRDIENNMNLGSVQNDVPNPGNQNCTAPNGLGLENLLRQIDNILPKQQIKNIIQSYDQDSQVRALKAYLLRPLTQRKIRIIKTSKECARLHVYVCRVLHINLLQYQLLVRVLVNPVAARSGANKQPGTLGLLNAINAVLPHKRIRALHRNLLASDPELVRAMNNLRSKEFRRLTLAVRNVREYQEITTDLINMGVPLARMREIVGAVLVYAPQTPVIL